jgi:hypothetical protein
MPVVFASVQMSPVGVQIGRCGDVRCITRIDPELILVKFRSLSIRSILPMCVLASTPVPM